MYGILRFQFVIEALTTDEKGQTEIAMEDTVQSHTVGWPPNSKGSIEFQGIFEKRMWSGEW